MVSGAGFFAALSRVPQIKKEIFEEKGALMSSLDGVNAVTIIFAALCVFAIGYRFYGLFIAAKVLNVDAA